MKIESALAAEKNRTKIESNVASLKARFDKDGLSQLPTDIEEMDVRAQMTTSFSTGLIYGAIDGGVMNSKQRLVLRASSKTRWSNWVKILLV